MRYAIGKWLTNKKVTLNIHMNKCATNQWTVDLWILKWLVKHKKNWKPHQFVWFIYLFSCFYCITLYNILIKRNMMTLWRQWQWWMIHNGFYIFYFRENVEINYTYFHFFICVSLGVWVLIFKHLFFILKVLVDNWKLNQFLISLCFNSPPPPPPPPLISFVSHSSWIFLFILCCTDNNPML